MTIHRVIFPPADYWTQPKEHPVTNEPAPINRARATDERHPKAEEAAE